MNNNYHKILGLDACLIAISPQKPSTNNVTKRKLGLRFEIFSDIGLVLSEPLGLVFELPQRLQNVYLSFGVDLKRLNADGQWRLPMPARLIVDNNKNVLDAEVSVDYTSRPEPSETIKKLKIMRGN